MLTEISETDKDKYCTYTWNSFFKKVELIVIESRKVVTTDWGLGDG